MNAPFSTLGAPEPQIVTFTPAMRTLIADAIESLILLLDEIDGDAEHEEDHDFESETDMEPNLGATAAMNQDRAWKATIGETDAEQDDADKEPSLGAPERHPSIIGWSAGDRQARWADGSGAMEEEQVNEDGDGGFNDSVDHEPSLGAINPDPLTGSGMDQTAWSRGNADDCESEHDGREPDADDEPRFVPAFEAG
jgi:hypothetical protein